jgi:hypothetical protein
MNKFGKATLLAGASALALGLATSQQASAFNEVDWEWDANIREKIKIYIDPSWQYLDPRGLVQVETLQISVGDIKAYSKVSHVYNKVADVYGDPRTVDIYASGYTKGHLGVYGKTKGHLGVNGTAYGDVDVYGKTKGHLGVDGTAYGDIDVYGKTKGSLDVYGKAKGHISVYGKAKDSCWWGKCDYDPVKAAGYAKLDVYGKTKGHLDVASSGYNELDVYGKTKGHLGVAASGYNELDVYGKTKGHLGVKGGTYGKLKVDVYGTAEIPVIVPNKLADLAEVNSSATAVANINNITGNSAVLVHDAQISVYGGKGHGIPMVGNGGNSEGGGIDNTNLTAVLAALALGSPAYITAVSDVSHILNANVNSSATAVANLHSIDVEAELATDVMVIADIAQLNYGDVTAVSSVYDVSAYHFEGLGGLEKGLVNSSATAVGNISTINVSVGDGS